MTTYADMTKSERDALAAKMVTMQDQGIPRAKIADMLGLKRNQVHGLLWRAQKRRERELTYGVVPRESNARPEPSAPIVTHLEPIASDVCFEPPPGKFNIWNIGIAQCRWLDEEGYFCGEATGGASKPYCSHHHKVCWVKPSGKSKRKTSWPSSQPKALQSSV